MNIEDWTPIDQLPEVTIDDYFSGGKKVLVTDGTNTWYSTCGDPGTWYYIVKSEGATHWKENNGKLFAR